MSVEELVSGARGGDAEAFAELIRRYEGIALSIAYSQTRNAADAADVTQEVFVKAWQRLDSLEDPARFGQWLGRMTRNQSIDLRRRRRLISLDPAIDVAATRTPGQLEAKELKTQIEDALEKLDEISRSCVVLRYYENLPSKEIAAILEISPAAVDMRISRARGLLKEQLLSVAVDHELKREDS